MPGEGDAPGIERLTASVQGRVQGVSYRQFCVDAARRVEREQGARITGYTRNLPGGAHVEVVAEGPRAALEALLRSLRQGPGGAIVRKVEVRWSAPTHEFDGFRVRHS